MGLAESGDALALKALETMFSGGWQRHSDDRHRFWHRKRFWLLGKLTRQWRQFGSLVEKEAGAGFLAGPATLVSGRPKGKWHASAVPWRWCFKNILGLRQGHGGKKTNVSCRVGLSRCEEFSQAKWRGATEPALLRSLG